MPYTILGDRDWEDYEFSTDICLEGSGWGGVMGRLIGIGSGGGVIRRDTTFDCTPTERPRCSLPTTPRTERRDTTSYQRAGGCPVFSGHASAIGEVLI
jgi:hypothetical protein